MSKIIPISQFKKNPAKKVGHLESAGIEKYEDMLDIQRGIIEELHLETEAFLKEINYPIDKFSLDDVSARNFISSDLVEVFENGEEELCISYIAHIDDTEYRTLATAEIDGEDIEVYVELFKKSGDEWLIFAEDGTWERGPGEDFF